MLTLIEWAERFQPWRRPWLLLGKGPSFDRVSEVDRSSYFLCSLNHVVRELEVTVAHAIDLDVVVECGEAIERNAQFLVMPFRPHVRFDPGPKSVFDLQDDVPTIGRMARAGRLVFYDLSSAPPSGASPRITAGHFSAESALELLAAAGAREVRSLGVDGGTAYSGAFADLSDRTRLANARTSFDSQFDGIAAVLRRRDVLYAPWGAEAPIRVFVGADPAQRLPARVLEWSLKRHASVTVAVETVDDAGLPVPARSEHRSRTGFSFGRFRIPARCGYAGRALYMDADMLALADVARLWATPLGQAALGFAPQPPGRESARHSVLLLDCARLRWDAADVVRGLDRGDYSYEALMGELCVVPADARAPALPPEWNTPERVGPETCLVHFTDMPTQPWVTRDNPYCEVWYAALRDALAEGFVSEELLAEEVARGHVSPDLPSWVGGARPRAYAVLRAGWVAPFRARSKTGPTRLDAARARLKQTRVWRRLTAPAPVARAYADDVASSVEVRSYPFRREEAKPGVDALGARLESERGLYAADASTTPLARLVVLHRGAPGAALERTLRLWELQSCPRRDAVVLARDGRVGPLRRALAARWGELPVAVDQAVTAGLEDDAFVVFARPGDGPHPSLATTLDRVGHAPGAEVVAWHAQVDRGAAGWELRTSGEREPLSTLTAPWPPRAFALRAGVVRRYPGDLVRAAETGGGQALLAWAAQRSELRWVTHPEFLTTVVPEATQGEADGVVSEITRVIEGFGAGALTAGAGTGPLPWCVSPRRRAARASVVVLFRDDLERTLAALGSVLDQRTEVPCELVLVAHRTRPTTRRALEDALEARGVGPDRVRWVPYEGPFNHSHQCDLGARAATGEVFVFLNNDARLLERATLQELIDWALVPGVGTVGCRLVGHDGRLVAAGVRVLPTRPRPWSPPVEESREQGLAEVVRETVANSFACAAVARGIYEAHGPLDARWFPAGYNDVEYGLRLRRAGLRHVYLGHLACEHEPGGSRPRTDELPQILELWRRYPELSLLGRCQLGVATSAPAEPLARSARERLRAGLPVPVRRLVARLRRGWT